MGESAASEYLTLDEIRDRLPAPARPPIRALRERADALGLPKRRWNRQRVFTEAEARCLLSASEESFGISEHPSPCGKRTVKSPESGLKNQLAKHQKLEQLGLLKTEPNTTTNRLTDRSRNQSHSQTRQ